MKKKLFFMTMALLPMVGFVACDDDDDNNEGQGTTPTAKKFEVVSTKSSDCLGSPWDLLGKDENSNSAYCDYMYDARTNTLKLIASNIQRNCEDVPTMSAYCIDNKITSHISSDPTIITNCECIYSDTIVMRGFNPKIYTLTIYNSTFAQGSEEIDFSANKNIEGRIYIDEPVPQIEPVYFGPNY